MVSTGCSSTHQSWVSRYVDIESCFSPYEPRKSQHRRGPPDSLPCAKQSIKPPTYIFDLSILYTRFPPVRSALPGLARTQGPYSFSSLTSCMFFSLTSCRSRFWIKTGGR